MTIGVYVITNIRKIGNSSGAIFPSKILKQLNLSEGDDIEITADNQRIIIQQVKSKPVYNLQELLDQCDYDAPMPDELKEWEEAKPVGNEVW
jgi:antitoxin ChpS